MTHWNTWFKIAFYVCDYFEFIQEFYKEEQKAKSSETIEKIINIFNDFDE
ncbi:2967_t:CDS:1, partial [Cetraspora pellucida]